MRLREIKGKRITGIEQVRFLNGNTCRMATDVICLILEDGTRLYPLTVETDSSEYAHDFAVNTVNRVRKGQTT